MGVVFFLNLILHLSDPVFAQDQWEHNFRIHNWGANVTRRASASDSHIYSPKSVIFHPNGTKFYVNSLEGFETLVYDSESFRRLKVIGHRFDQHNLHLFQGETTYRDYKFFGRSLEKANIFKGKPVEFAFSHDGKYLWVPYYRRDFDTFAQSPSAVAIINTESDEIERVMPVGPVAKVVAISPDSNWAAIVHWGDNSVELINISSASAKDFKYEHRFVLGEALNLKSAQGQSRDRYCGECLRGTVFTNDSRYLIVASMSRGGAISGFDILSKEYLGTLKGFPNTPRHLEIDRQENLIYITSNSSGFLSRIYTSDLFSQLLRTNGRVAKVDENSYQKLFVGAGARTVTLNQSGDLAFVVSFNLNRLSIVDTQKWQVIETHSVDPHPVGLAISPNENLVVVTSQGHKGKGGNAVNLFQRNTPDAINYDRP